MSHKDLEGILSSIRNNLTDAGLSKSECGLICSNQDLGLLHNLQCTGGVRTVGFFSSHPAPGTLDYPSHDTVKTVYWGKLGCSKENVPLSLIE